MRKEVLKEIAKELNLEGLLFSSLPNIFYLSGFSPLEEAPFSTFSDPVGFLLYSWKKDRLFLLTDVRQRGARFDSREVEQVIYDPRQDSSFLSFVVRQVEEAKISFLGIERDSLLFSEGRVLERELRKRGVKVKDISGVLLQKRAQKEKYEITKLKKALEITEGVLLECIEDILEPGITEKEVALFLETRIKSEGCSLSFPPIVAFGPGSAVPHYSPGNRKLKKQDVVLIDLGAKFQGYCGDLTRTFFVREMSKKQEKAYFAVLEALEESRKYIRPGEKARVPYLKAVEVLERYGLASYFTHGLGHGVGIEIHELPRLSLKSEDLLKENQVITVEPGVYFSGQFGIRIEDTALVTPKGAISWNTFPKEPIIL